MDKNIHSLHLTWSCLCHNGLCCCNLSALEDGGKSSLCTPKGRASFYTDSFSLYLSFSVNRKAHFSLSRKVYLMKKKLWLLKIGWCNLQGASVQSYFYISGNRPPQPHHTAEMNARWAVENANLDRFVELLRCWSNSDFKQATGNKASYLSSFPNTRTMTPWMLVQFILFILMELTVVGFSLKNLTNFYVQHAKPCICIFCSQVFVI